MWIGWKPVDPAGKDREKSAGDPQKKNTRLFAYGINRNPLLRILDLCPKRLQLFAIRQVLKQEK